MIGFAKFPRRYEEILGTFAHNLPPPGEDIDSILTTSSVFDYCEVSKCPSATVCARLHLGSP